MGKKITLSLSNATRKALEQMSAAEGIPVEGLIDRAVKEHLFSKKFRLLRERLQPKAEAQGIRTDDDVFKRVS